MNEGGEVAMNDDGGRAPADGRQGPARRTDRTRRTGTDADMGERMSGDGGRDRRRPHPGGGVSGPRDAAPRDVRDTSALETALAAALRAGAELDPEAEQRAVAAFRAARGAGAHRAARTRRRDDWRQPARRRAGRSLKTTFGMAFAGLALGGVAVAAIGSARSSTDGAGDGVVRGTARPSAAAPDWPGAQTPSASADGARAGGRRPAPAQDTEAHCRAYEHVEDRGKALDATAWQRLVTAAGGKDKVAAYCSEQLARAKTSAGKGGGTGGTGGSGGTGAVGSAGAAGSMAAAGGTGVAGSIGVAGGTGVAGSIGVAGGTGVAATAGTGSTGVAGSTGVSGSIGAAGGTGGSGVGSRATGSAGMQGGVTSGNGSVGTDDANAAGNGQASDGQAGGKRP